MQLGIKRLIKIIIVILLISNSLSGQTTDQKAFIGDWVWQNGNKTFIVKLFTEQDNNGEYHIEGDFRMEENNNGNIITTYTSEKLLGILNGVNQYDKSSIYGNVYTSGKFGGSVRDNILAGDGFHITKRGHITITIQNSCSTCPIKAKWKVKEVYGARTTSVPKDFSIPTDIILTKQ